MKQWEAWYEDQGELRYITFESDETPTKADAARRIATMLRDSGRPLLLPDRPRGRGEDHVLTLASNGINVLVPVESEPPLPNGD
jgi:hypothetical protein